MFSLRRSGARTGPDSSGPEAGKKNAPWLRCLPQHAWGTRVSAELVERGYISVGGQGSKPLTPATGVRDGEGGGRYEGGLHRTAISRGAASLAAGADARGVCALGGRAGGGLPHLVLVSTANSAYTFPRPAYSPILPAGLPLCAP